MNIEESIEYLKNYKYDNEVRQAIETLLTAYEKEKEKNKEYENMIINHKKQLKQSGIYGYDYDLKILKEE